MGMSKFDSFQRFSIMLPTVCCFLVVHFPLILFAHASQYKIISRNFQSREKKNSVFCKFWSKNRHPLLVLELA